MIKRDRIYVEDLRVKGIIGIFDWEKETKQEISISYEIDQDNLIASNADKIEAATDYKSINKAVKMKVDSSSIIHYKPSTALNKIVNILKRCDLKKILVKDFCDIKI